MIPTKNLPTCPLSVCPSIYPSTHPSVSGSIYQILQGAWHCVCLVKHHLLKTYCQTVSNVESIFVKGELYPPFHERAGANVHYLDHPAKVEQAGGIVGTLGPEQPFLLLCSMDLSLSLVPGPPQSVQ